MTEEKKIRCLAERFLEGETSLEEERELLVLVKQGGLPDDLQPLHDLMMGLDAIALEEPEGKVAQDLPRQRRMTPLLVKWLSAAAVVLLVAGAAIWWHYDAQNEHVVIAYGERCTDREVVLKEMTNNLSMVAETPLDDVDELLDDMFDI